MQHVTDPGLDIAGTFTQGRISATRQQVERVFGKPIVGDGSGTTNADWFIKFEDGTIATIYDWKSYMEEGPQCRYKWYIGGRDKTAVDRVVAEMQSIPKIKWNYGL